MWFLLWALFLCLLVVTFFMPWVNRSRIMNLRSEVEALRVRIVHLETGGVKEKQPEVVSPPDSQEFFVSPWGIRSDQDLISQPVVEGGKPEEEFAVAQDTPSRHAPEKPGFEIQFGEKLPVWVGGIALALAGFYLVKYSIDIGLLSPAVRITIGALFGAGMLFAGYVIRKKEGFSNGVRIAQSLSGAGIADLYVCIFTATNIYHLLPMTLGFGGMAVVTAIAVILSLRHGAPIAWLGMIGGFLTPALMSVEQPSALILFGYLYVVMTGLMVVIRRQGWWKLGLLTVAASFIWVIVWLTGGHYSTADAVWLCLFVLMVTGTVFGISSYGQSGGAETIADKPVLSLNNIVAIAGLGLLGCVMTKSDYGWMEWGLFWLLSAGTIVMAYFQYQAYRFLPWVSMIINGFILFSWQFQSAETFAITLSAFALLYVSCGYFLQERSNKPFFWGAVVTGASTGFYVLSYTVLHDKLEVSGGIYFWGGLAFVFAILGLYRLMRVMREMDSSHPDKQRLLSVYAAGITSFISLALMIVLDRFYFTVALAAEVLALTWICTRVDLPNLRKIAGLVAGIYVVLMLPQLLTGVSILFHALFESRISSAYRDMLGEHPLIQLGLAGLLFIGASLQLLRKKDGHLVKAFEIIGIVLVAMAGHYIVYQIMYPGQNALLVKAGFVERGVITNIIFLCGLFCLWAGKRFGRRVFSLTGLIVSLMAVFRICYLDLILHNPLWNINQNVGDLPLLNGLLLTYGLPIIWIMQLIKKLPSLNKESWVRELSILSFLFAFVLVSFEVRQFFHGTILTGRAENVEIYAYSVAWLLFGLALLFFGTPREIKMMRIASLCLMVLTVGKVFLYDASELVGLYRVFSFFGLGLSLLGLSWFYSRFVFLKTKA